MDIPEKKCWKFCVYSFFTDHSKIEKFYVVDNEEKEVTENETITYNCSVDSNPESEILLLFNGKQLRRTESTKTLVHTKTITSCFDDGFYKCEAKNKLNTKPSFKELKLAVRCK